MSERPIRVQLSRRKGWKMPPNTVSVARPGRWGNPFDAQAWGRHRCVILYQQMLSGGWSPSWVADLDDGKAQTIYRVMNLWRVKLGGGFAIDRARTELAGKNLACWCGLSCECHADVLLKLANPTSTASAKGAGCS